MVTLCEMFEVVIHCSYHILNISCMSYLYSVLHVAVYAKFCRPYKVQQEWCQHVHMYITIRGILSDDMSTLPSMGTETFHMLHGFCIT